MLDSLQEWRIGYKLFCSGEATARPIRHATTSSTPDLEIVTRQEHSQRGGKLDERRCQR